MWRKKIFLPFFPLKKENLHWKSVWKETRETCCSSSKLASSLTKTKWSWAKAAQVVLLQSQSVFYGKISSYCTSSYQNNQILTNIQICPTSTFIFPATLLSFLALDLKWCAQSLCMTSKLYVAGFHTRVMSCSIPQETLDPTTETPFLARYLNATRQMECFTHPFGLFHMCIWERPHRKCLERGGSRLQKRKKYLEPHFKRWLNKIFGLAVSKWANQNSSLLLCQVGKSKPWPFCCCKEQHLIGITGLRGATVWNCESKEKLSVLYFTFLTTAQKQAQKNNQHGSNICFARLEIK